MAIQTLPSKPSLKSLKQQAKLVVECAAFDLRGLWHAAPGGDGMRNAGYQFK